MRCGNYVLSPKRRVTSLSLAHGLSASFSITASEGRLHKEPSPAPQAAGPHCHLELRAPGRTDSPGNLRTRTKHLCFMLSDTKGGLCRKHEDRTPTHVSRPHIGCGPCLLQRVTLS